MKKALRRIIFVIAGVVTTFFGIFLCSLLVIIFVFIHRLDMTLECKENPAVLEYLNPYLEEWATQPDSLNREELLALTDNFEDYFWVYRWPAKTIDDDKTMVIEIITNTWYDWSCGYLYVHDGSTLSDEKTIDFSYSYDMFQHTRLTEQIYRYESSY